jgi:transcriptional regulator with GAF, ATPase, and Fis domain
VGSTFLRLRTSLDAAGLLDTAGQPPAAPGLLTLLPSDAAQLEKLERLAPTRLPVLLGGESGAGKEVVARAVHTLSQRPGPFVAVNCGGLSSTLIESELFGYRKGAFSGALEDRPGLVRTSDHGTLFLDEVGDLPSGAQATLLRVLQESEVVPVGGTRPVKVDLRVVAATHRDLAAMVEQGTFRADLLARLSGFLLRLPPLRARREDLGWIIAALIRRHAAEPASVSFSVEATRLLLTHEWPLNVRELEKTLLAAITLAAGGQVECAHLPAGLGAPTPAPALDAEDQALRAQLVGLFQAHAGNVSAVADAMGKARFQIQRWMKRLQIDAATFRK